LILPPSPVKLYLHRARIDDAGLLFDWRNEALVREMSFDPCPIAWEAHLNWLKTKLGDRNAEIVIGEDGLPVGQARLDCQNGEAVLSYSVDPDLRGLGFGRALVEQAVRFARRRSPSGIRAHVKHENAASRKIFHGLGWHETILDAESIFRRPRAPLRGEQE
jgi:UDP-2,4-diacetamido-2,4,6-trideoxy-beta-L-altropyranose hydrolase